LRTNKVKHICILIDSIQILTLTIFLQQTTLNSLFTFLLPTLYLFFVIQNSIKAFKY